MDLFWGCEVLPSDLRNKGGDEVSLCGFERRLFHEVDLEVSGRAAYRRPFVCHYDLIIGSFAKTVSVVLIKYRNHS